MGKRKGKRKKRHSPSNEGNDGERESQISRPGPSAVLPSAASKEVPVEDGFTGLGTCIPNLSAKHWKKQVTNVDFVEISKLLGEPSVWKRVGRQLGIEDRQLNCIDSREKEFEEKAYQMLQRWKEQYSEQCTVGNLHAAITNAGYNDRANKLLSLVFADNSKSMHPTKNPTGIQSGDDIVENLQKKLKDYYKRFTLPQLPWVEEGLELLVKDFYSELQLSSTKQSVQIEDIFKVTSGTSARLLIEGQPGFGKTTLMTKLAYDWSVGEVYMQPFIFVFVIKLKEIQDNEISSIMYEIASHCGFNDKERFMNVIEENLDKVLILLDGFDEIPDGISRESTMDILYRRKFPDATVAVTCRNGMFETKKGDRNSCKVTARITNEFWDKKIDILGLSEDGTKKLLGKIFSNERANKMVDKLKDSGNEFSGICKSPLIVTLLGYLYANGDIIEFRTTRTKLYSNILNGLAKYSCERRGEIVDEHFNLFDGQSKMSALWQEKLSEFGMLCFRLIKNSSDLQFPDSDLIREIYSIGFLSKNQSKQPFKKFIYFEPFHRSFAEYFAAFYITRQYLIVEVDDKIIDEITEDLHKLYWDNYGTSLILPFVIGIMGNKANFIFLKLAPYIYHYQMAETLFWRIVEECEESDAICDSLKQYLPKHLLFPIRGLNNPKFFSSNFFESIIRKWSKQHESSTITFDTSKPLPRASFHCHVHEIVLQLYDESFIEERYEQYSSALNNVSCEKLMFTFVGDVGISTKEIKVFLHWLKLKQQLNAQFLSLMGCDSSICNLLNSSAEISRGEKLSLLYCDFRSSGNCNSLTNGLLAKFQIHTLIVNLSHETSDDELLSVIENISQSSFCASFELNGPLSTRKPIDLSVLNNCGKKSFDCLSFHGFKLLSNNPNLKEMKLNILRLMDCTIEQNVLRVLLNSNISALTCPYDLVLDLIRVEPKGTYRIHESLTELTLIIYSLNVAKITNENFGSCLTNFRNINCLTVNFYSFDKEILNCAVDPLKSMELSCVKFRFKMFDRYLKFIRDINSFIREIRRNDSFNSSISVIFDLFNKDNMKQDDVNQLLNMLDEEIVNEIIVEDPIINIFENFFSLINVKKFEIKFEHSLFQHDSPHFPRIAPAIRMKTEKFTITKRRSPVQNNGSQKKKSFANHCLLM